MHNNRTNGNATDDNANDIHNRTHNTNDSTVISPPSTKATTTSQ